MSKVQLDESIDQLTKDRFQLAVQFYEYCKGTKIDIRVNSRNIISRGYYAMYHFARAIVFHTYRYEIDSHERLPGQVAKLVGKDYAEKLKEWRMLRNEVDYSPYTEDIGELAERIVADVKNFMGVCKEYLEKRGVNLG